MELRKGDRAPGFNLPDQDKNFVNLMDFQGKHLLILFYPLAFTSTCTVELCQARDGFKEYEALDTAVVGISVDPYATLREFKKQYDIQFPLLSDFNKEASRAYGCLYEEFGPGMRGVSKRATFLVDKMGFIQYVEVLENAGKLPNFKAVLEALSRDN